MQTCVCACFAVAARVISDGVGCCPPVGCWRCGPLGVNAVACDLTAVPVGVLPCADIVWLAPTCAADPLGGYGCGLKSSAFALPPLSIVPPWLAPPGPLSKVGFWFAPPASNVPPVGPPIGAVTGRTPPVNAGDSKGRAAALCCRSIAMIALFESLPGPLGALGFGPIGMARASAWVTILFFCHGCVPPCVGGPGTTPVTLRPYCAAAPDPPPEPEPEPEFDPPRGIRG